MDFAPETTGSRAENASFSDAGVTTRLQNEVTVLGAGFGKSLSAMKDAAQNACDHPGQTAVKVAVSTAFGFGLGYLSARTGTLGLVGRGLGVAAGLSFAYEGVRPFYDSMAMAWKASDRRDLDKASDLLGQHIGAFTVDTAIQTPGAMLGTFAGNRVKFGQALSESKIGISQPKTGLAGEITAAAPLERASVQSLDLVGKSAVDTRLVNPTPSAKTPIVENLTGDKGVGSNLVQNSVGPTPVRDAGLVKSTDSAQVSKPGTAKEGVVSDVVTAAKPKVEVEAGQSGQSGQTVDRVKTTANNKVELKTAEADKPQTPTDDASAISPRQGRIFGYRFIQIRPDSRVIEPFDLGVGVRGNMLPEGKANISGKLIEQAVQMPKESLPKFGSTLAVSDKSLDSITAISILANRIEGRKVNPLLVDFLLGRGKEGAPTFATERSAIEAVARMRDLSMGERARFVRGILDDSVPESQMRLKIEGAKKQGIRLQYEPAPASNTAPAESKAVLTTKATADTVKPIQSNQPKTGEIVEPGKQTAPKETADKVEQRVEQPVYARGPRYYNYVQLMADGKYNRSVDFGLGIAKVDVLGGKPNIDRIGGSSIIDVALKLHPDDVPAPGSSIGVINHDAQRLTALAILNNRMRNFAIDDTLAYLVSRGGTGLKQIHPSQREYYSLAFNAIDGISNASQVSLPQKVLLISRTLSGKATEAELVSIADQYKIHRSNEQPFVYVRTTPFKPKNFDFGVEITEPKLLKGQPNLDHHGIGTSDDMPSAAQQALKLSDAELPQKGHRVAIQKPDADALTAVAVMANRVDGMPVNSTIVEAVGLRDRGLDPTQLPGFASIEAQFNAVRSVSRNEKLLINQRITAIRDILAGTADEQKVVELSERMKRNAEVKQQGLLENSQVDMLIPDKLSHVKTEHEFWFAARNLGLEKAPVTLISTPNNTGGTHFQILARHGGTAGKYMPRAFLEFQTLEPGWGGRPDIFVSPHSSKLPEAKVIDTLKYYVEPPKYRALWWDASDYAKTVDLFGYLKSHNTLFNSISALGSESVGSLFGPTPTFSLHASDGLQAANSLPRM